MSKLIWIVFLAGIVAAQLYGGSQARILYLVFVSAVIVLFRRPLVIALTHLASMLGLIKETIEKMPVSIRLVRTNNPQSAALPSLTALRESGFIDAGNWDIAEIPKIKVSLMVHPTEGMLGVVETADPIGAQVNLHTLYSDGQLVTFTNTKLPSPKLARPNTKREKISGASPSALVKQALAKRPKNSFHFISVDEAPRLYEKLYAEEIAFRKLQ